MLRIVLLVALMPLLIGQEDTAGASALAGLRDGRIGDDVADRLLIQGASSAGVVASALESAFDEPKRAEALLTVLFRLGPEAGSVVPVLVGYLEVCSEDLVPSLAEVLAELAPYASPEVRASLAGREWPARLEKPGSRRSWQLQHRRMLARLGVDPEASTEELIAEVRRDRIHRRAVAAECLGRRGWLAYPAAKVLLDALDNAQEASDRRFSIEGEEFEWNDGFEQRAAEALVRILPRSSEDLLPVWLLRLDTGSAAAREQAAHNLGLLGLFNTSASIIEALTAHLEDESAAVIKACAAALTCCGTRAAASVTALRKLSDHADPTVWDFASHAIQAIENANDPKQFEAMLLLLSLQKSPVMRAVVLLWGEEDPARHPRAAKQRLPASCVTPVERRE